MESRKYSPKITQNSIKTPPNPSKNPPQKRGSNRLASPRSSRSGCPSWRRISSHGPIPRSCPNGADPNRWGDFGGKPKWVFPKMVVPPKHPKMVIIFSRKTKKPRVVGETHHFRNPPNAGLTCPDTKNHTMIPTFLRKKTHVYTHTFAWEKHYLLPTLNFWVGWKVEAKKTKSLHKKLCTWSDLLESSLPTLEVVRTPGRCASVSSRNLTEAAFVWCFVWCWRFEFEFVKW